MNHYEVATFAERLKVKGFSSRIVQSLNSLPSINRTVFSPEPTTSSKPSATGFMIVFRMLKSIERYFGAAPLGQI